MAGAAPKHLAAMIEGGEDPRYIARRIIVLASEDVGNADPAALTLAACDNGPSAVAPKPSTPRAS